MNLREAHERESPDDRDESLIALIEGLTDQLRRGEAPDLDEASRCRPDLAEELHALWAAALITEEMAGPACAAETVTWTSLGDEARPEDADR
jgi:hypothetical protein